MVSTGWIEVKVAIRNALNRERGKLLIANLVSFPQPQQLAAVA